MKKIVNVSLILAIAGSVYASPDFFVKTSATGNGQGSNWANACNLQYALEHAALGDEIWMFQGTYKLSPMVPGTSCGTTSFFARDGITIYGSFDGSENNIGDRNSLSSTRITADANLNGVIEKDELVPIFTVLAASSSGVTFNGIKFDRGHVAISGSMVDISIEDCQFVNFHETEAVLKIDNSQLFIVRSVFEFNEVNKFGAIINVMNSSVGVENSRFFHNKKTGYMTGLGGMLICTSSLALFWNCLFAENEMLENRLYKGFSANNALGLINCTFSANQIDNADEVYTLFNTASVRNCILWSDRSLQNIHSTSYAPGFSLSYSILNPAYNGPSGSNTTTVNPALNSNYELSSTASVAYNAGNPSSSGFNTTTHDLNGYLRYVGNIDIGAFEYCSPNCSNKSDGEEEEEKMETDGLTLYPNPNTGSFVIESEKEITGYQVFNASGQLIQSKTSILTLREEIELNSKSKGVYFVKVQAISGGSKTKRMIVN